MLLELINKIKKLRNAKGGLIIIAISGFGGSGKSTLAENLKGELGNAELISIDVFITSRLDKRSADWEGFDRDRFRLQVLEPAKAGEEISYQEYDWPQNKIVGWKTVPGSKYLIVEGCSLLHPNLLPYYDFTIWIDYPLEAATERGMARDRSWGADHDKLWHQVWMPNEQDFFNKYRPDNAAGFRYRPEE